MCDDSEGFGNLPGLMAFSLQENASFFNRKTLHMASLLEPLSMVPSGTPQ